MEFIDNYLNRTTMYRLVLHYLAFLWVCAFVLSIFGLLPYAPGALILSTAFIIAVSWMTNTIFSLIYKTPTNLESVYITALILILIITPPGPTSGLSYLAYLAFVSVWAMAGKFILSIGKKHIFNPAALAVALAALLVGQSASWWIGSAYLFLPVLLGGLLIVRKLRRKDLVISFLFVAFLSIFISGLLKGTAAIDILQKALFHSPLLFFAFIMLTEPLTTPPTKMGRIFYGALTGFIFAPNFHIGSFFFTPELALLTGNIFSYLISPKEKLLLTLKKIIPVGFDMYDFVFVPDQNIRFRPGQYLEWTLSHEDPDNRGNRRYFTIASSPTEEDLRMGVKFYPESSSFKRALGNMKTGDSIIASQLSGEFVLPSDKNKKLVFIAGGIGITPFRSMIKYLLDHEESRDIVLFYSNKKLNEVAYKDIFDEGQKRLGIKTVYCLTDKNQKPALWCRLGRIDADLIRMEVPDYEDRLFYISGPHAMVDAFSETLTQMGVRKSNIIVDFFPGFV